MLLLILAACSGSSGGHGQTVAVTATDTACTPAATRFASGKLSFKVTNKGREVTEVYVYGKRDTIEGEVENVVAGTTRSLDVNLKAGTYEIACKPGMKGNGIRVPITVTGGAAQAAPPAPTRAIDVHAVDYLFQFDDPHLQHGDVVSVTLTNGGTQPHEFEVLGPDGKTVGEVAPTPPGQRDTATIAFAKSGTYTYRCNIADHRTRGMQGTLVVG